MSKWQGSGEVEWNKRRDIFQGIKRYNRINKKYNSINQIYKEWLKNYFSNIRIKAIEI